MRMLLLVGCLSLALAGCKSTPKSEAVAAPHAPSFWVGTWSTQAKGVAGELHASIKPTAEPGSYEAVFAGTCGQAFLYELTLPGAAHGDVLHFEGDVDLGPEDGGVYGWVGAVIGDTFIGEYRNARYKAGSFKMTRATQAQFEASARACGALPAS